MTASATSTAGGLASVFAFLSIIPARPGGRADGAASAHAGLYGAARSMHLFPVAGCVIGLLAGLLAWVLLAVAGLEPLLAGLVTAAALLVITGLHHTDGLADFADGLMARGTHSRRRDAMKDKSTGTAGTAAIVLCVAGLIITISMLGGGMGDDGGMHIVIGIILAEVAAKFSMVVMAYAGRPAPGGGSGAIFAEAMKDGRKVAASAAMTVPILVILGGLVPGLAMLAVCVLAPVAMAGLAGRSFGGVTGDVFGAANDIVRIASLAVFVSL